MKGDIPSMDAAKAPPGDDCRDTALAEENAQLRERVKMLETVIENFPGGISLYDAELRMVLCNTGQKRMLELPDWFTGSNPTLEDLIRYNARRGEYGPGDPDEMVSRRMALVAQRVPHCYERTRPNGDILEIRGMPIAGGGFLTTYLDVTEQRINQDIVAHMARHDPLTNLPNRTLYRDRLEQALAHVRRNGSLLALHFIDLDYFKPVNDRHGHKVGDQVLNIVAERLRRSLRECDTVARLGGDEFAVIQSGIVGVADAETLAIRMLELLQEPFALTFQEIRISASVGIAMAPRDGILAEELEEKADTALYRSKHGGRRRYCFYSDFA